MKSQSFGAFQTETCYHSYCILTTLTALKILFSTKLYFRSDLCEKSLKIEDSIVIWRYKD